MRAKEQNIDRFDAYLNGELSHSERSAFEKELAENETLKIDFETYKVEVNLIKALGIREEMGQVMSNKGSRRKSGMRRWLIPLGVAAAVVLIALFAPGNRVDNRTLFGGYFEAYPNAISGRDFQDDLSKAMNYYDRGEYIEALKIFDEMTLSDTVTFYQAISHLALKEPEKALTGFSTLDQNGIFYKESLWFRGLGFLLVNKSDSIIYYMEQIEESSPKREAAQKILEYAGRK